MNIPTLKGRPPFPFATIGVAVAFSPRLEGVLGEAKILAEAFQAQLLLIHAGESSPRNEATLRELCERLALPAETTRIIWSDDAPVPTLLNLCKEHGVDLLVLGALRRENVFRYYLGSVARKMCRTAKCSLLLLTEPRTAGTSFAKIVVGGNTHPKTIHTLNTAVYFGQHLGTNAITVVSELDQPGLAMAMADSSTVDQASQTKRQLTREAADTIHSMLSGCSPGSIAIREQTISGRPGYAIRQYAEEHKADLIAINSPDSSYGLIDRIFPHDLEYLLEELPCNLLIVHSRVS